MCVIKTHDTVLLSNVQLEVLREHIMQTAAERQHNRIIVAVLQGSGS